MVAPRRSPHRPGVLLALAAAALCVSACASSGPDRNVLPDRPQVHRTPQPEGLRDVRSSLATQRADTRDAMDAALINTNELSTTDTGPSFFESALGKLFDFAWVAALF